MNHSKTETREHWYESAGTRLFVVDQGHGSPIVFLHGGLADHRASTLRLSSLRASHRLLSPDVRGAGRSKYSAELSWDVLAEDVLALLDHFELEQAVIGGISAGSGIALRFALRHPERVSALVLVSPVYAGTERGLNDAQRLAKQRMREAGERMLGEGIDALLPLYAALPAAIRDVAIAMAKTFDPASVAATTRFLASGTEPFDKLADLGAINAPTLVVPGADPEHPAALASLYVEQLPQGRLAETAQELASTVADFLQETTSSRPSA